MTRADALARWEHFPHGADIGVRGIGATAAQAFEQAALALTGVITNPERIALDEERHFTCEEPDVELLFVDWLNTLVYAMADERMIFGRFKVALTNHRLDATCWGEKLDRIKHEPAVEVKGATYTELCVKQREDNGWIAQCVVDV